MREYLKYDVDMRYLNKIFDKFANKNILIKVKNYWKQNFKYI